MQSLEWASSRSVTGSNVAARIVDNVCLKTWSRASPVIASWAN